MSFTRIEFENSTRIELWTLDLNKYSLSAYKLEWSARVLGANPPICQ